MGDWDWRQPRIQELAVVVGRDERWQRLGLRVPGIDERPDAPGSVLRNVNAAFT